MDSESSVNYINGDEFLANIFMELIRRKTFQISIKDLVGLEYNYITLLSGINILENSVDNIMRFASSYEEYLQVIKEGNDIVLCISNEDEFKDTLLYEFEQNKKETKNYEKAVKKLINEQKKIA